MAPEKFLELTLSFEERLKKPAAQTSAVAVLAPDGGGFREHVADDAAIGRLAARMITVFDKEMGRLPDGAAAFSQAQLEFIVSSIEKFLMPIGPDALINTATNEHRLVTDVIEPVQKHVIVVTGFAPSIDRLAAFIDEHHIAKKRIPLGMGSEGLDYASECAGPETIVGIEDDDELAGCTLDALVHGIVMAFILLRSPLQMRMAFKNIEGAIGRTAIHDDVFPRFIILLEHALDGLFDGGRAVE